MSALLLVAASFLASGVAMVEALTIILASGLTRGWRSSLLGAATATVVLAATIAVFGVSLVAVISVALLQVIIGAFPLIFGLHWLRKAILRYAGLRNCLKRVGRGIPGAVLNPPLSVRAVRRSRRNPATQGLFRQFLEAIHDEDAVLQTEMAQLRAAFVACAALAAFGVLTAFVRGQERSGAAPALTSPDRAAAPLGT